MTITFDGWGTGAVTTDGFGASGDGIPWEMANAVCLALNVDETPSLTLNVALSPSLTLNVGVAPSFVLDVETCEN